MPILSGKNREPIWLDGVVGGLKDAARVRARLAWRMRHVIKPTALKVTGCQAEVSLRLASDDASTAVDRRLLLPESGDPASLWRLDLDVIDETRSWGIDVPLVVAVGRGVRPRRFRSRPQPVCPEAARTVKKLVIEAGEQTADRCSGGKAPARAGAAAV